MRRGLTLVTLATLLLGTVLALATAVAWLNLRGEEELDDTPPLGPPTAERIARGAYLARAGNCAGCHTAQGGAAYAGGRGIDTPFGTVFASNLTPDAATGIGGWSAGHFWRALHNGRSRDGRLLYPAFPYPHYTLVTHEDSQLLFDFLRSQPAVARANTEHTLRWPYSSQAALAVWRALYFSPGSHEHDPAQTAQWHRGAYLVRGLAHCAACHSPRNALGATDDTQGLSGALIPMQNWYAPSLASPSEASVAAWPQADIVSLLRTGVAPRATVLGPMAQVVSNSTQHLTEPDLQAMTDYLKTLPQAPPHGPSDASPAAASVASLGAKLYEKHCADCHGAKGEGVAGAYPPLAGNRAVTMPATANLVQIVMNGGFAPATAGNPRPYGMPPYVLVLSDAEIAAVLTHLRTSWGNQAAPVSEVAVNRQRDLARR